MKKMISYRYEFIRLPIFILLLLLMTGKAIGQVEKPLNRGFKDIAKPESTPGWIYFKEGALKNAPSIFEDLKDAFELSKDDEMRVIKTEKDKLGFTHLRYQQYYKKHRVVYGEYMVHQRQDGFVKSANGKLITGLNLNNNASITETQALASALQFMGAKKYLWQNTEMEKELKRQKKNVNATYYPKGELVYAPAKTYNSFTDSGYRLAWLFKIYTDDKTVSAKNVYVDALTGKVIYHTSISISCSPNSGVSTFNGTVFFKTENFKVTNPPYTLYYRSHNDCQSADIYVYNCNRGGATTTFYEMTGSNWNDLTAVQAQWGAFMTYKYYDSIHSRKSWDDQSGDMIAYNNANISNLGLNNACWGCNGDAAIFGGGTLGIPNDDWNTDDIMGHEFTHGVIQATAGLDYEKESGALNESFSDIFGEMIESFAEGNCDYLVGADKNGGAIRSFINPKNFGQPDTYLGTNWVNTNGCSPDGNTNDNCGVHTNSGVQNHWFYLLSEGGSGVNDKGESYNVTGITRFKARYIVYRALLEYLNSSSQFIDARKASLEAADDLFGACSPEKIAVADAWHAVGVESQSSQYIQNVCGTFPQSGTFLQALSALTAANGCTVEITPSASTVYFAARDLILLNAGFKADEGSNFIAYINPCSGTLFKNGAMQPAMSDAERGIKNYIASNNTTALKESLTTDNISIGPNPFNTVFTVTINSEKDKNASIIIYNSIGLKVKKKTTVNLSRGVNKASFNCADLPRGVYLLEVNFGDSKTIKKLVRI